MAIRSNVYIYSRHIIIFIKYNIALSTKQLYLAVVKTVEYYVENKFAAPRFIRLVITVYTSFVSRSLKVRAVSYKQCK